MIANHQSVGVIGRTGPAVAASRHPDGFEIETRDFQQIGEGLLLALAA
jgi:hypothetical protein